MATTPTPFTTSIRGVSATFTNGSIEDITVTRNTIAEQIADQYGAIACEMVYDHRYDLTFTMHAAGSTAPVQSGDTLSSFDAKDGEGAKDWHVDSVAQAGSYQNVTRWTITAHRFDNTPPATTQTTNP
jgi:hypothetical protein